MCKDSILRPYHDTGMQKLCTGVHFFRFSTCSLVSQLLSVLGCNSTRNSIEWFCLLDKILRTSATLLVPYITASWKEFRDILTDKYSKDVLHNVTKTASYQFCK